MTSEKIKSEVHDLFAKLKDEAFGFIKTYPNSPNNTAKRISNLVATRLSAKSREYIADIYFYLQSEIEEDEYFKDPSHLNRFYRLNLRDELNEKYRFDVDSSMTYKNKIDFEEINRIYATTGATVGSLTLGGILKLVILETINIPIAVIIAGSVCAGVTTYFKVSDKNEKGYRLAVKKYLDDMEKEVLDWLDEVERYFRSRVASLKE